MSAIDELRRLREVAENCIAATVATFGHSPWVRMRDEVNASIRKLEAQPDPLRELLTDVANSGVSFDDERLKYVEVQIDRSTWDRLQQLKDG